MHKLKQWYQDLNLQSKFTLVLLLIVSIPAIDVYKRQPQRDPTRSVARITTMNGAPVFAIIQAIVAERHTIDPTEISISPSTRMYAIGSIKKISAR